jgi:hypothetical protein
MHNWKEDDLGVRSIVGLERKETRHLSESFALRAESGHVLCPTIDAGISVLLVRL